MVLEDEDVSKLNACLRVFFLRLVFSCKVGQPYLPWGAIFLTYIF